MVCVGRLGLGLELMLDRSYYISMISYIYIR